MYIWRHINFNVYITHLNKIVYIRNFVDDMYIWRRYTEVSAIIEISHKIKDNFWNHRILGIFGDMCKLNRENLQN